MFGRKRRGRVEQAVETVQPYAQTAREVAGDEKARRRAAGALASLFLLRRRLLASMGLAGLAWRIANDAQLPEELNRLADDLVAVRGRAERARARRRRRMLAGLVGSGAAAGAAFAYARARGPARVEEAIEVAVPVTTAYNQWTQFEEFPSFMEGIEEVRQLDETHLHWVASLGGRRRGWDAEISEQRPDERVVWHATSGKRNTGVVTFHRLADDRSKVMVQMEFEPEGLRETVGTIFGLDRRRIKADLERFSQLLERRGAESGAWRGTVERGALVTDDWTDR
jgi:uncharacterized membrane protein